MNSRTIDRIGFTFGQLADAVCRDLVRAPGNPAYDQTAQMDFPDGRLWLIVAVRDLDAPLPAIDEPVLRAEDV